MSEPALAQLVKVEVRWHRTTGVAADDQINTFFVSSATEDRAGVRDAAESGVADLRNFLDGMMPGSLFTGAPLLTWSAFDMLEPEPRFPFFVGDVGAGALSGAQALPEECTAVVSFEGVHVSGQSQRRRRGRMYLPTFTVDALDQTSSTIWDTTTVTALTDLMEAFVSDIEAGGCHLVVFSRVEAAAAGGTLLNQAQAGATIVVGGWVDNEPDTQRRRGRPGGTKTAWTP